MLNSAELLEKASSLCRKHHRSNSRKRDPKNIICGQKTCSVADMRYGLFRVSYNGCGPIAVYNALIASDFKVNFCDVLLSMEMSTLSFMGLFGTDSKKLDKYFADNMIAAVRAHDLDDFKLVMSNVHVGILCYKLKNSPVSGIHYVTVINLDDGRYAVCNLYNNKQKPSVIPDISRICDNERFISAYFFA